MAAPPPVADNVPPQVTGVKVIFSNLVSFLTALKGWFLFAQHFRPLNEDDGEKAPNDTHIHIISKNKINAAQASTNTDTSVAIQDKTLYSKDQKVNGLLKQLGSYTSVTAVSKASIFIKLRKYGRVSRLGNWAPREVKLISVTFRAMTKKKNSRIKRNNRPGWALYRASTFQQYKTFSASFSSFVCPG